MILGEGFVLAERNRTEQGKIYTDFVDLHALLQRFQSRLGKELGESAG